MNLLLILIFGGAAIVNYYYFNTRAALWITLSGLLLPLLLALIGK